MYSFSLMNQQRYTWDKKNAKGFKVYRTLRINMYLTFFWKVRYITWWPKPNANWTFCFQYLQFEKRRGQAAFSFFLNIKRYTKQPLTSTNKLVNSHLVFGHRLMKQAIIKHLFPLSFLHGMLIQKDVAWDFLSPDFWSMHQHKGLEQEMP